MNRRTSLALGTTALLSLGIAFSGAAFAQQKSLKDQLVGSWTVVSVDNTAPDGKKSQTFGPNPKGVLIFGANGQYSQTIVNPGVPHHRGDSADGEHHRWDRVWRHRRGRAGAGYWKTTVVA